MYGVTHHTELPRPALQVQWHLTFVYTVLETQASTELNRRGTNILVVKGTAHARLKEIRAKATVIALANFIIICFTVQALGKMLCLLAHVNI